MLGDCCYNAYACDPDNKASCILTQTERVFDDVVTVTTVVDGKTETITSTEIFYPWPTVESRATPKGDVSGASSTTAAPAASGEQTTTATTAEATSSVPVKAAAGHVQASGMGVIGIVAAILV